MQNHQQEFDFALYNHTVDVAQSISVDFFGDFTLNSNIHLTREKIFPFSTGRSYVQIISLDGQIVYKSHNLGSSNLVLDPQDWQAVFQKGFIFKTVENANDQVGPNNSTLGSYRQITYLVRRGKPLFILQIAVPLTLLEGEAKNLILFFAKGVPITLFIAGLFCFYLAHRSLSPMREIVHRAERLSPFRLSERIPETGAKDEIDNLTITLNQMLSRIEKAFKTHENFIADASHQLKTPLAIVRGELDLLKGKEESIDQVKLFSESAQQELQHMSRLIDHLLLLAKIDAGASSLTMSPLRLDEILIDVISRLEILAKRKEISIKLNLNTENEKSEFIIKGDLDLIQSMFSNLI
ncbi:MAG: HAMP domain-containing histidine kinase, partial [Oligoflexia bacterium]|nr:HAMP domain-containing histidine kinase [Oligoflexia bacterium]